MLFINLKKLLRTSRLGRLWQGLLWKVNYGNEGLCTVQSHSSSLPLHRRAISTIAVLSEVVWHISRRCAAVPIYTALTRKARIPREPTCPHSSASSPAHRSLRRRCASTAPCGIGLSQPKDACIDPSTRNSQAGTVEATHGGNRLLIDGERSCHAYWDCTVAQ